MKTSLAIAIIALVTASPALAQQGEHTRGYFTGVVGLASFSNISGFSTSGDQATTDLGIDLGGHVRRHLLVFGEGGWMRNLQKGVQQSLVDTTTSVYANHGVGLTGTGSLPVWYGLGGLGIDGPTLGQWTPYVLGGAGIARREPSMHFTYNSGTIAGQTTAPAVGSEVTSALTTAGYFKTPQSSTARTIMVGGGVRLALGQRVVADGAYHYLQIAADAALNAKAVTTNEFKVGLGVRF